jgi:CheY-like chemotaxis protein
MPEGGRLLIETAEKTIDEAFAELNPDAIPGRYVCLSVSDTGKGIPSEVLPHIFEPFFTTKEPGKGTGLGLATVFGVVKQHRGWISVSAEPGKGANFQVYLPRSKVSAATVEAANAVRPKPARGTETILLAEDSPSVRRTTRLFLERNGYGVLEASNGVEALKIWDEQGESISLLLTDLVMPAGVSGQQLARKLQQSRPKLKVIFTSGYSAEIAGRELELRAGENFLQKPFPPEELLETIRRCLDN